MPDTLNFALIADDVDTICADLQMVADRIEDDLTAWSQSLARLGQRPDVDSYRKKQDRADYRRELASRIRRQA